MIPSPLQLHQGSRDALGVRWQSERGTSAVHPLARSLSAVPPVGRSVPAEPLTRVGRSVPAEPLTPVGRSVPAEPLSPLPSPLTPLGQAGRAEGAPIALRPIPFAAQTTCRPMDQSPGLLPEKFQIINPVTTPAWDEHLANFPKYSFFHSASWARVLNHAYGHTPHYLILTHKQKRLALLPIMEVNSRFTGRRGVSLPFTDHCEPLLNGYHPELLQGVLQLGRARNWKYWECRGWEGIAPASATSLTFYRHILKLRPGADLLWTSLDPAVRRAVHKAERSNLRVDFSQDLNALKEFYRLHCTTRRRHGLPPQSFAFFRKIYDEILAQNNGWIVRASLPGAKGSKHDTAIAAAVFFHFGKKVVFKFAASDPRHATVRANNLVMWEAIKSYAQHGFDLLDFGRTSLTQEGLRRFKSGWGATEEQLHYLRYDFRKSRFVQNTDRAAGWHNRFFKHMPVIVNRLIGKCLYPHIA